MHHLLKRCGMTPVVLCAVFKVGFYKSRTRRQERGGISCPSVLERLYSEDGCSVVENNLTGHRFRIGTKTPGDARKDRDCRGESDGFAKPGGISGTGEGDASRTGGESR